MLTSFLDELKRRGVLRVAAAYAVVAFVVWQAAEILVPALRLPDLALTLVVVTTLLGFPIVLAVAWIFDITPGGLRRTEPSAIDGEASTRAADAALAALVVVAVLAVAAVAVLVWPSSASRLDRQRVAVAVFENQTGDPALDPVGRMAAEWITDGVTETGLVEVVDSRTCLAASQIVSQSLAAGANLVRSFGEEVGAGTLVWGSYYPQGDSIQLRAEIVDANEGNALQSVGPVSAPLDRPEEGIELLRQRVLSALAALLDPRFADWETAPRQPVLYTAYLSYAEGTDAYMRSDFVTAAARFQHAAELDTTYVRAMLWAAQSYLAAVFSTAEQAFLVRSDSLRVVLSTTRDRLTPYDQARLDFLVALRYRNWFASYEATRAMMDAAPGYVDARREAAIAALRVNRPAEAIELLGQLDPERASLRGWGGYYRQLTQAHHMLGRYHDELRVARRGRRDRPHEVWPLLGEARALAALGRIGELERVLEEGSNLPANVYGFSPGDVFARVVQELEAHGYSEASPPVRERMLAWFESRNLEEEHRWVAVAYGAALVTAERWAEARSWLESLAARGPAVDLPVSGYLAVAAAKQGDREAAERVLETIPRLPPAEFATNALYWRARVAAINGESERALALLRESISSGWNFGEGWPYLHAVKDFDLLRDEPAFQELMRPRG